MTAELDVQRGTDYWDATTRLRDVLRRNKWDTDVATRRQAAINYVFDTNVFIFHANILDEVTQIEDLAGLLGVGKEDPFLTAMERLTAGYMFSGRLPAQVSGTAYISSQHFEEVMTRVYELDRTIENDLHPSEFAEEAARHQERVRALLSQKAGPREDRVAEVQKILPKAWLGSLQARTHFDQVMEACFLRKRPTVTPLHNVPWGWEAGRPRNADVDFWLRAFGNRPAGKDRNRLHDAQTLATMVELYRNDRLSRFDTRNHLYLFVTTDHTIANAVSRQMSRLRSEGIPYFVRTPKDYFPVLNMNAMGRLYGDRDDAHIAQLSQVFQLMDQTLNWTEADPSKGTTRRPHHVVRPIAQLQDAWKSLSEVSTLLNAKYFEDSNRELFEGLTEFVSAAYEGSLRSLKAKLDTVRLAHVSAVLDTALSTAKYANEHSKVPLSRRAQLKLIGVAPVERFIGSRVSVATFVDEMVASGTLDRGVEAKIQNDPANPAAAMLVASLFLAAENWSAASDFAEQAYEKLDSYVDSVMHAEAGYLRALCLRFSMQTDLDFPRAQQILTLNLLSYGSSSQADTVQRRLRDQIERATLLLSASVMQAILESGHLPGEDHPRGGVFMARGQAIQNFEAGMVENENSLNELITDFSAQLEAPSSPWFELGMALRIQATTNLAGAWIFSLVLPKYPHPKTPRGIVLESMRDLIHTAEASRRPLRETQYIYERVLTSMETEGEHRRIAITAALKRMQALNVRSLGLPANDRIRFHRLEQWLQARDHETIPAKN